MHRWTAVAMAALIAATCSATFAQEEDISAFRVRLGLIDMGDADAEVGIGVDYEATNWMVSTDYVELDSAWLTSTNLWSLSAAYLFRQDEDPGTYYGAGLGYYRVDVSSTVTMGTALDEDSCVGFEVLGGMSFGDADSGEVPPWFAEFRYVLGTDVQIGEIDGDVDGWKLMVGRRF